jgi:hypothetical protein
MTAAIFGLVGVLIGGVLSSAGEAWLDRRRQLLEGIPAARLVSSELRVVDQAIQEITWQKRVQTPAESPDLPVVLWHEHRAALAVVLTFADWERVARPYAVAAWVNEFRSRPSGAELSPGELEKINTAATQITKAIELLNSVGDGSRLSTAQKVMFRLTGGWLAE